MEPTETKVDWRSDMFCVLSGGKCLANVPAACMCLQMPRLVYEEYLREWKWPR